jgi:hypothetical protein
MTFVAPAGEPWSGAHLLDLDRAANLPSPAAGYPIGFTVCGRELVPAELWLEVPADCAQPVCGGCRGAEVQEAMFG